MRRQLPNGAPVVVKIGSSSLTASSGGLDPKAVTSVVDHVEALWAMGHPVVLVSSGAVSAGLPALGLTERPRDVPGLQVAAAVGQGRLMELYTATFGSRGRVVGQILLTRDVLARRDQYLHSREAIDRMLALGIQPIVNENDTVVVDELKLGDNDRLAAIVSHLSGAGMMIILSDTPGLFTANPLVFEHARLLEAVKDTDEVLDSLRDDTRGGGLGSGGAATKVAAARMAAWSGIPTVIASAAETDVVTRCATGQEVGTWFEPHHSKLSARKLWIAFGVPSEGELSIDSGAAEAVTQRGKSLLPAGVVAVAGRFDAGDAVEVVHQGDLIAKGLAAMSAAQIGETLGQHSSVAGGEAIHRDDLVVLA